MNIYLVTDPQFFTITTYGLINLPPSKIIEYNIYTNVQFGDHSIVLPPKLFSSSNLLVRALQVRSFPVYTVLQVHETYWASTHVHIKLSIRSSTCQCANIPVHGTTNTKGFSLPVTVMFYNTFKKGRQYFQIFAVGLIRCLMHKRRSSP